MKFILIIYIILGIPTTSITVEHIDFLSLESCVKAAIKIENFGGNLKTKSRNVEIQAACYEDKVTKSERENLLMDKFETLEELLTKKGFTGEEK